MGTGFCLGSCATMPAMVEAAAECRWLDDCAAESDWRDDEGWCGVDRPDLVEITRPHRIAHPPPGDLLLNGGDHLLLGDRPTAGAAPC